MKIPAQTAIRVHHFLSTGISFPLSPSPPILPDAATLPQIQAPSRRNPTSVSLYP
jgi:hypothetical protein